MGVRVLTVVGARPQFVKCAVVSAALRRGHEEILVHTGQHYDHGMSALFFEQLGIPEADINLGISGGSHGEMTGRMMTELERVIRDQRPDWVMVYGDTNSTLAAALVAAKLHVPVAHVEAGLRSFNKRMPEEINRICTDHVSRLLLCPTDTAVELLKKEGVVEGVHNVGDVMLDSVLANVDRARERLNLPDLLALGGLPAGAFAIATIHRPQNTDHPQRLRRVFETLAGLGVPVLLPLHPRTAAALDVLEGFRASLGDNIRFIDPVGYLELLLLISEAAVVLTDSGGVQKEAFFLATPCVTLRDETEWLETVEVGANAVVGSDQEKIEAAVRTALSAKQTMPDAVESQLFGDGQAAGKIVALLEATA